MRILIVSMLFLSFAAWGKPVRKPVAYEQDGRKFEGVLVYDDSVKTLRPGVLLVPNWLGINEANLRQAELVAGTKYVIFVADMYGTDARPKSQPEAAKAAGAVKGDRKLMRARANKALEVLKASGKETGLASQQVGAIGFCFGGTTVIELAKSGANVGGVVSFHGGLDAREPTSGKVVARVLALHGADDPTVSAEDLSAFVADLKKSGADWTLVEFGNAVHSFTDVDANTPGRSQYNEKVAKRSYAMMNDFFAETFAK